MVQSFGNVDIKPWIGKLQHDFVLSFLIGMTNQPKIKKENISFLSLMLFYPNLKDTLNTVLPIFNQNKELELVFSVCQAFQYLLKSRNPGVRLSLESLIFMHIYFLCMC